MKVEDLLSSEQCDEIITDREEWVFGPVPYHEACMRRAAIVAVREFAERIARRLERVCFSQQQSAELLRNAVRELDDGKG